MPQVILLAALGAGLYAGYRAIVRAGAAMSAELKRSDDELRQRTSAQRSGRPDEKDPYTKDPYTKDLGALEFDPRSGVYKPVVRNP